MMGVIQRILRIKSVCELVGLSKARVYALERQGRFPHRIEIGPNSVGWLENEIAEWISSRRRRPAGIAGHNLAQSGAPQS